MRQSSEKKLRRRTKLTKAITLSAASAAALLSARQAHAVNYYYDVDATSGLTAGTATWNLNVANTAWQTTNAPGVAAPITWANGNDARFDGTGTNTVTVDNSFGTVIANSISQNFNSITTTIGGGSIQVGSGTSALVRNTGGSNLTINSVMNMNGNITFDSTGTGTVSIAGGFSEMGGTRTLTKTGTGAGALILSTNNAYSGATFINGGTVTITTLGNTGGSSSLGSNSTINIGTTSTAGTLGYLGAGETSDKIINLAGTSGGATINNGGTGALKFTSNLTATGSGTKTLTLAGNTAGTIEIAGIIADSAGGATNVTRAGTTGTSGTTGISILSGANTYSGLTTVSNSPTNGGTLIMSGTNSSAGAITVGGGILVLNNASNGGLASGVLTLNNGQLQATTASTATLSNAVTLATGSGGFTINGAQNITLNGDVTFTGTVDKGIVNSMTGGATLTLNGNFFNLSQATTNSYLSSGTGNTIINSVIRNLGGGAGGSITNSSGSLTLTNANTYSGSTTLSGGSLTLSNTAAISSSALTMSGGTLNLRSDTNNDTFGATSRTISASTAINVDRLTAGGGTGKTLQMGAFNVTAATTATLTVSNSNNFGLSLGAITQTPTTATTFTVANSAPVTLASFATNSTATPKLAFTGTGTATVTGNITQSGSGALALERSTAAGSLILQGTSNMTGAVTISNGTIQTAVATNAFGSTSGISMGAAGVLALRGDTSAVFGNGVTAYPVSLTASGATINVDQASSAAPGTTLSLGNVTMTGVYTLNTTGANGLSLTLGNIVNNTTSSSQGITFANNIASPGILTTGSIGYPTNTTGTGNVNFTGTGTTLVTGAIYQNLASVALTQNNASGLTIITGTNTNTGANNITAGTLQVGNNGTTGSLGTGTITITGALIYKRSDAVSVANTVAGAGTLTQAGGSSLTLTGAANTFSGGLIINSGSVVAANANAGVIGSGTVTMANNTTLDLGNNNRTTGLLSTSGDGTGVSITNLTGSAGARTLTASGTTSQTFAGVISDGTATTVGLTKANSGTQNLTGSNTYTGATTVTGGTLGIASGAIDSTSAINLNTTGVTLQYLAGNTTDLSAKINNNAINGGSGAIINIGVNNVTFGSTMSNTQSAGFKFAGTTGSTATFSGATSILSNGGPIVIESITANLTKTGTPTYISDVTLQTGALYKLSSAAAGTTTGSTTPNLTINTNSVLDLNGNNYNLQKLSGDSTAKITNSAAATTSTIRYTYLGGTALYAGLIEDGAGIVAVNGNAVRATDIVYTGSNTYSGGTSLIGDGVSVHALSLALGNNSAIGTGDLTIGSYSTVKSDSATDRSLTNNVTVNSGTGTPTFGTPTTGNLSFGTLSTSGTPTVTIDNAQTTFTSATGIAGMNKLGTGTLIVTGNYAASGATTITAGTLQIGGSVSGNITNSATLALNTAGSPAAYAGVISGAGNVTKSNTGTFTMSGSNSYSGTTTINGGTLAVNGALTSSTNTVTVNASGTLGGSGTIAGAISGTGTVSPGNSPGALTAAGGIDFSGGMTYSWQLGAYSTSNAGTDFDIINVTGGNFVAGGSSNISLSFLSPTANPDASADPFWNTDRSWKVVDVSGAGANPGSTNFTNLVGATFTKGSFNTTVGTGADAGDIFLNYDFNDAVNSISLSASASNTLYSDNTNASENPGSVTTGSVHIAGNGVSYTSEVDGLTSNQNTGSVTVDNDLGAGTPVYVMLWTVGDQLASNPISVANGTLIAANTDEWNNLQGIYGNTGIAGDEFEYLFRFTTNPFTGGTGAVNWAFATDPGLQVDRIAVVPEPASLSAIGLGAVGLLMGRRRRRRNA